MEICPLHIFLQISRFPFCSFNYDENIKFAKQIGISTERVYENFEKFINEEAAKPESERMEAVSVLTPNFLHFPMAKKLLENGFNVICEKPLTTSLEEAKELEALQKKNNTIFAVTYTYTGYPMVREMKNMIANGLIGEIHKVDLQYYQGWINPVIHDKEKRSKVWRLDPKKLPGARQGSERTRRFFKHASISAG